MCTLKQQAGLTLVELMVAMVIGLLLLAGISQVFVSNKQTYRLLEAQSHAQENGRFAFEFLAKDIRMADFWGCQINTSKITDHIDYSTLTTSANYITNWNGDGVTGTDGTGLNGSDTITLRGAFDSGIFVEDVPATPSAALKVTDTSGLLQGDLVLVTDCQMGEFFSITDNTGSGGFDNIGHNLGNNVCNNDCSEACSGSSCTENSTKVFGKKYGPDASIYKFGVITYDLKTGTGGEPALYKTYNGVARELVTGVENMQITYGVDNGANGNVDYYATATTVTAQSAWDNVVTVRVTLTSRSPEQNVIIDAANTSGDNRLRRNFSSTMAVRNRLN
jgi:type IV pilus assembly protein PilW